MWAEMFRFRNLSDTAKETRVADLVCLSTLMTTTMGGMKTVIDLLEEAGIRKDVKVMVGGGPVSRNFADEIRGGRLLPECGGGGA